MPIRKKVLAVIAGVIALKWGNELGFSEEQVEGFLNLIMVYIVGQGITDHGKSKEELAIKQAAQAPAVTRGRKAGA